MARGNYQRMCWRKKVGNAVRASKVCSSEVQRDKAAFTPSVLKCSVNTVTRTAGPQHLCRAAV